jgi:hypothetical protein
MLSSRRVLADEGTPVRQRVTTDAFPESFVPQECMHDSYELQLSEMPLTTNR